MPAAQFLEDSDRSQPGSGLQHRDDFIVPDISEWIGAAPFPGSFLLGWKSGILFEPVSGGRAESSFGGGEGRRMSATQVHEKPHLTIGDMSAGQRIGPLERENRPLTQPPLPPDGPFGARRRCWGNSSRATPSLRHPSSGTFSS